MKYPLYIFFKLYWKIIIKNIITPILQDLSNVLSNVLHYNHSVILNYFCIKAKVSFQRFLPTLESFQYIGIHWKTLENTIRPLMLNIINYLSAVIFSFLLNLPLNTFYSILLILPIPEIHWKKFY